MRNRLYAIPDPIKSSKQNHFRRYFSDPEFSPKKDKIQSNVHVPSVEVLIVIILVYRS